MLEKRLRVAIIIGSTRQGRFGPTVANWLAAYAAERGDMEIDLIDLAEARLPEVMTDDTPPAVAALAPRLAAADAFIVVTPEYNHGYPAALKTAIDWYQDEWKTKPVAFAAYGGVSGGLRAVEQLRQVFAELHAPTVRDAVSFHGAWEQFDAAGKPRNIERSARAATTMLRRLAWWGETLREARGRRPYPA